MSTKRASLLSKRLRLTLLQLGQARLLSSLLLEPPDMVTRLADRVLSDKQRAIGLALRCLSGPQRLRSRVDGRVVRPLVQNGVALGRRRRR